MEWCPATGLPVLWKDSLCRVCRAYHKELRRRRKSVKIQLSA